MEELYPDETFWASYLSCLGIANTYHLDDLPGKSIVAVSGQYFRNLDWGQIKSLIYNNFLLLNGDAVHTLCELGYGQYIGVAGVRWHSQDSGFAAYEQVINDKAYAGLKDARVSCQVMAGDFLEIEYIETPEHYTVVKNYNDEEVASGIVVHNNRVLIFPYGRFEGRHQTHLHPVKQAIIQEILRNIEGLKRPAMVENAPFVSIWEYDLVGSAALFITNFSNDDYNNLRIFAPGLSERNAKQVKRSGQGAAEVYKDGDYIILQDSLRQWESRVLLFDREK